MRAKALIRPTQNAQDVGSHPCILSSNVQLGKQSVTTAPRRDISNLRMCRSKNTIGDISDNKEDLTFLDTVDSQVTVINGGTKPWTAVLQLNNHKTEFKIDTGADVTVIPTHMYRKSRDGP